LPKHAGWVENWFVLNRLHTDPAYPNHLTYDQHLPAIDLAWLRRT
jgi:hypothetical protein